MYEDAMVHPTRMGSSQMAGMGRTENHTEDLPLAERLVNIAEAALSIDQILDAVEARLLGQPPSYDSTARGETVPGRPAVYNSVSAIEKVHDSLYRRAERISHWIG